MSDKPEIGCEPEVIWIENRIESLVDAIARRAYGDDEKRLHAWDEEAARRMGDLKRLKLESEICIKVHPCTRGAAHFVWDRFSDGRWYAMRDVQDDSSVYAWSVGGFASLQETAAHYAAAIGES